MRRPGGRAARIAAVWVAAALAGCGASSGGGGAIPPGGRGPAVRLRPSAVGAPVGPAVSVTVGVDGATLTSPDGALTVALPAGALPEGTALTLQAISDTAPGGVGPAFRLQPAGALALPATLTFRPDTAAAGVPLDALTVAVQNGDAFWVRYRDVARDATAGTLVLPVSHFSDWAVVTSNTASDLRGRFTLTSTLDGAPFTAVGDATLNYGGDDAQGAHYLQWGAFTLQAPVVVGALTCDVPPPWELFANVADLSVSAAKFDWGVSAYWSLTCRDGAGNGASSAITTAFDTYGINQIGCARGWVGTPVVSLVQVQGTYVIDCGARGRMTADLDFRNCSPGAACAGTTCHAGVISCAGTYATCVDGGNLADGTPCPGGVCGGGTCNLCVAGEACTSTTGPCQKAAVVCTSGFRMCADTGNQTDGTTCPGGVCGAGACNPCLPGEACPSTTSQCTSAAVVCTSGFRTCTDTGNEADGTPCTGGVCGGGLCNACVAGEGCTANPDPCKAGGIACGSGFRVCEDTSQPATNGTQCPGGVCGGGVCNACVADSSCAGNPSECKQGATVCASGFPACVDGASKTNGTVCPGGVCGGGACNLCVPGQGCPSQTSECKTAALVCTSGFAVCTDTGDKAAGISCTGGVCGGDGVCNACVEGQECSIPGDPCAVASLVCSSGRAVCTKTGSLADGASCGGPGLTCNGGTCVASSAVTVARQVTFWPDAGPLTPIDPADAGAVSVRALEHDLLGGWHAYPGAPGAGGFTIANVPDGATYWVALTDAAGVLRAVETTARSVDLGFDRLGRPDVAFPTAATVVPIALRDLSPAWQATDLVQLVASNADLLDAPPPGVIADDLLSLATSEDWNASAAGGKLPLLDPADTVAVHQLSTGIPTTGGGSPTPFLFHAVSRAASASGIALSDGNPGAAVSIDLTVVDPSATATIAPSWRTDLFEALAPAMAPAGTTDLGSHALRVSASAGPLSGAAPVAARGTPDLFALQLPAAAGPLDLDPMSYGQPLAAPWNAWQGVEYAIAASYAHPQATTAVAVVASVGQREPLSAPPASPIAPLLSPVQEPVLDGTPLLLAPLTGVGATPTFSWTAPATGAPTRYELEIFALGEAGGATTTSLVATFTATSTGVPVPPGVLQPGTTYLARITARAAPGDLPATSPLRTSGMGAWAQTLTVTFTP